MLSVNIIFKNFYSIHLLKIVNMELIKNKSYNFRIICSVILILLYVTLVKSQSITPPDGYAAYKGTTGGGSAIPVFVSSASEFKTIAGKSDPAVIIVEGMLDVGEFSIESNKTIIGSDSLSGLYGGTIKLRGSNYILQNLTFGPADGDVMEASGATKIFVTKCSFHDCTDELFSIVRESDYVTVSWCKFYFSETHSHAFGSLIGNRDDRTSDRGKLHVTMHHNWYADGVKGRQPRVRYGHVHIYNNYHNSIVSGYCIGTGFECHIRLENTHFDNVSTPWRDQAIGATESGGEIGWNNIKFTNSSEPSYIENSYPVFDIPYSYSLDSVDSVKAIVTAGAGNVFGGNNNNLPEISITAPANESVFNTNSDIAIEADALVTNGEIAFVSYYSDTLIGVDSVAPFSCTWENPESGIYSIVAIATDTNNAITISDNIKILVGSGVSIASPIDNEKFIFPTDININAIAWDSDGNITKVEFFDGTTLLGDDDSAPYSFTWNDVQPGTYVLSVKATDNNSNIIKSDDISVNVVGGPNGYEFCCKEGGTCKIDGVANVVFGADGKFNYKNYITDSIVCSEVVFGDPNKGVNKSCYIQEVPVYISLISPTHYSTFSAPDSIVFAVNALVTDGIIDSVQFLRSGIPIGTSVVEPFSFIWKDMTNGGHSISAKVYDNEGNTFVSNIIHITVKDLPEQTQQTQPTEIANLTAKNISVYPNPVFNELFLDIGDNISDNITLTVYNSYSKKVMERAITGGSHILSLEDFSSGLYFIRISNETENIVRKIIKY